MRRREIPEINAGSMADIAFLLLVFFLVATTIDNDVGIFRKLPPMIKDIEPPPVRKRNLLHVLVNRDGQLMVKGKLVNIVNLKKLTKDFICNENLDSDLPIVVQEDFEYFGQMPVTKHHIISLQSDRGTPYGMYITVQNELAAAYNELRDELAQGEWGVAYKNLPADKKEVIADIYPLKISEAEPN